MGQAIKGYHIETTGEDYILSQNRKIPVFIDEKTYLLKDPSELVEGDRILVERKPIKKSLDDILPVLEKDLFYRHASEQTHTRNANGENISNLRIKLLEGLIQNGYLSDTEETKGKILMEQDFSDVELEKIISNISGVVELSDTNGIRKQRIKEWLNGKTLQYNLRGIENESELITALSLLNPDFENLRDREDSTSWRYNVRLLRAIHSSVERYLGRDLSEVKQIEDAKLIRERNKKSTQKNFSEIKIEQIADKVRQSFMVDFNQNYSIATITKATALRINPEQYKKGKGLEGKLGEYELDGNIDLNNLQKLSEDEILQSSDLLYNIALNLLLKGLGTELILTYLPGINNNLKYGIKGANYIDKTGILNYCLLRDLNSVQKKILPDFGMTKKSTDLTISIVNGQIDKNLGLKEGTFISILEKYIHLTRSVSENAYLSELFYMAMINNKDIERVYGKGKFSKIITNPSSFWKKRINSFYDIKRDIVPEHFHEIKGFLSYDETTEILKRNGLSVEILDHLGDCFKYDSKYQARIKQDENQKRADDVLTKARSKLGYVSNFTLQAKKHDQLVDLLAREPEFIEEGLELIDVEYQIDDGWARTDIRYKDSKGQYLVVEVKQEAENNQSNFDNAKKAVTQTAGYQRAVEAQLIYEGIQNSKVRGMLVAYIISDNAKSALERLGLEYRELLPELREMRKDITEGGLEAILV